MVSFIIKVVICLILFLRYQSVWWRWWNVKIIFYIINAQQQATKQSRRNRIIIFLYCEHLGTDFDIIGYKDNPKFTHQPSHLTSVWARNLANLNLFHFITCAIQVQLLPTWLWERVRVGNCVDTSSYIY